MIDKLAVTPIEELLSIRPITEAVAIEVLSTPGYEHLEITNGEWVEKYQYEDMSIAHGQFGGRLFASLWTHVEQHQLGVMYMAYTIFILHMEENGIRIMRKPNMAFVVAARVKPPLENSYYFQAPDLAVELVSLSQSYAEIADKIDEYFQYGTKQVWLVLSHNKQIEIYFPDQKRAKYGVGQKISGGDLLPGFMLDVGKLFGV